ncbi:9169_t:CDS:2 [Entrophospora sp. SA101]|nr:9169_t:CDS:2 [Entrophospora sp. SA101]
MTSKFANFVTRQNIILPSVIRSIRLFSLTSCFQKEENTSKSQLKFTGDNKLSWNDYFALRRKRRLTERLVAIPSTIGALGGSLVYVATREYDPTLIFGQEPLLIYAIGTVLCTVSSLILGPIIGSSIWKLFHSKEVKLIEEKDKDFYEHIKKNRADASLHSLRNPAPDYYGEKIKSVTDYRKWLRKQRDIIRKGTFHIGEYDN